MRQALFKCETPRLKLKSSRSFLAIKLWQRTKSKKVIKHLRSSKLRWAHICAHSRIPVEQLWMGIWQHIHTVATTEVSPDLGELAEILDDVSVEMIPLRYR